MVHYRCLNILVSIFLRILTWDNEISKGMSYCVTCRQGNKVRARYQVELKYSVYDLYVLFSYLSLSSPFHLAFSFTLSHSHFSLFSLSLSPFLPLHLLSVTFSLCNTTTLIKTYWDQYSFFPVKYNSLEFKTVRRLGTSRY